MTEKICNEVLNNLYHGQEMTSRQIARIFHTTHRTVLTQMEKHGIARRPKGKEKKLFASKEELEELYWEKRLSTSDIAKLKGVHRNTVFSTMRRLGIKLRTMTEAVRLGYATGKRKQPKAGDSPNWKCGRTKDGRGYVLVYAPNHPKAYAGGHKYVYEHILVWENCHGKPLPKDFMVHHLNGIKHDNRAENLVAIPKSKHDTHTKVKLLQKRIRQLEGEIHDLLSAEAWGRRT